ncbi:hypothetical protein M422DRAFT_151840, partial [Sphaerobolus stellatus SS14]
SALSPAGFPTQLQQLISAISHVMNSGVTPSNTYLSGNSSGGNLVLQLVTHSLHPLSDTVKKSPIVSGETRPIGGVIPFSPMVSLSRDTGSHEENVKFDVVSSARLRFWGLMYLASISESRHQYQGIDKIVSKILITAGENESLRNDIVLLGKSLKMIHMDVTLDVQKNAVHIAPIFDFAAKETSDRVEFIHKEND